MPSSKKTTKNDKNSPFKLGSISLSHQLESWLKEIGVDVKAYENELKRVFDGKKCRYYRIVDKSYITNDHVVNWLRDVELFITSSNVNKGCYGIDASSAAVVDSLRLKRLSNSEEAWILDMCCAPGGKLLSTISCLNSLNTPCKWNVLGLDSVKRRLDVCRSMLSKETYDKQRINVFLKCSRSQDLLDLDGESLLGRFDRIILDVECTHEGSIRSVIRTIKYWGIESLENKWNREYASNIISNQRELLHQAIRLIKPNGLIVYSTCSLDREQNEMLVSEVVNEFDNIKFYTVPVHSCPCCSSNSETRTEDWPSKYCTDALKALCNEDRFYKFDESQIKDGNDGSVCRNINSPAAVRFVPMEGDTDGLFVSVLIRIR